MVAKEALVELELIFDSLDAGRHCQLRGAVQRQVVAQRLLHQRGRLDVGSVEAHHATRHQRSANMMKTELRLAVGLGHTRLQRYLKYASHTSVRLGVEDDVDVVPIGTGHTPLVVIVQQNKVHGAVVVDVLARRGACLVGLDDVGVVRLRILKPHRSILCLDLLLNDDGVDLLLLLLREQGALCDEVRIFLQQLEAVLAQHTVVRNLVRGNKVLLVEARVAITLDHQADGRALRHAVARARGDLARHQELGLARNERGTTDGAPNLGRLHHLGLVVLERRGRHKDERLLLTELVAAHATRQSLHECRRVRRLGALPHKGHVLLAHHLARAEAAAHDDDRVDAGCVLQVIDGNVGLLGGVVHHLVALHAADGLDGGLLLAAVLALREADEGVLGLLRKERLKVLPLLGHVKRRLEEAAIQVLAEAEVALARHQVLDVLGVGRLLVHDGADLGIGRGRDREEKGVLLHHLLGVAVHAETVLAEELVHLHAHAGVHVRLVHHDEGVRDVHGEVLEVLAEEHGDGRARVVVRGVLLGLVAQLRLGRPAQDVGALDLAALEHAADELVEAARLARLALRLQQRIAHRLLAEDHRNVGCGSQLLGRRRHCTTVFRSK